jgi:hypothetical protein
VLFKEAFNIVHLKPANLPQLLARERVEDDNLIQTVQQLRPEMLFNLQMN